MELQEKLRLIRGYRKLSTTKLEYILSTINTSPIIIIQDYNKIVVINKNTVKMYLISTSWNIETSFYKIAK